MSGLPPLFSPFSPSRSESAVHLAHLPVFPHASGAACESFLTTSAPLFLCEATSSGPSPYFLSSDPRFPLPCCSGCLLRSFFPRLPTCRCTPSGQATHNPLRKPLPAPFFQTFCPSLTRCPCPLIAHRPKVFFSWAFISSDVPSSGTLTLGATGRAAYGVFQLKCLFP